MKGRGPDYDFDADISPGSDIMGILAETELEGGKTQFELMLAERLGDF